jgi:hypothetical protein
MPTRGDLGSYDVNSRPSYKSYGLDGDFGNNWGWTYQTANSQWVDSSSVTTGDITG